MATSSIDMQRFESEFYIYIKEDILYYAGILLFDQLYLLYHSKVKKEQYKKSARKKSVKGKMGRKSLNLL